MSDQMWDLWFPGAGSTGLSFCRSRIAEDKSDVVSSLLYSQYSAPVKYGRRPARVPDEILAGFVRPGSPCMPPPTRRSAEPATTEGAGRPPAS